MSRFVGGVTSLLHTNPWRSLQAHCIAPAAPLHYLYLGGARGINQRAEIPYDATFQDSSKPGYQGFTPSITNQQVLRLPHIYMPHSSAPYSRVFPPNKNYTNIHVCLLMFNILN